MCLRRNASKISSPDDRVVAALERQATALEALVTLIRVSMGRTPEEREDVPWERETEPTPPPEDPNDPETWMSTASDERSAALEREAAAKVAKAR